MRIGTKRGGTGVVGAACLVVAATAAPATAQRVVVAGGVSPYDLAGTGTTGVASARFEKDVARHLTLEAGTAVFRYEPQGGGHATYLMPEVGVRVTAPVKAVTLGLGVGGGFATSVEGRSDTDPTLFGALGLDVPLGGAWSVRPEARVRVVDPWVGTTFDLTLGVARDFGPGR